MLWFHGSPGAREQLTPQARELALSRGIRLLMVERPGIGESTPHLYRQIADFARDVEQLVNSLGIQRFATVGLSGGGPYSLACAHAFPRRVVMAAILGGVAPSLGEEAAAPRGAVGLLPYVVPLVKPFWRPLGQATGRLVQVLEPLGDQAMDLFLRTMPAGDRRVFQDPEVRRVFQQDIVTGSRQGLSALYFDLILFGQPWGFRLQDIQVPVRFWHGDADTLIPLAHAEHMARLVPDARLQIRTEEGHLGGLAAAEEVFETILSGWPLA